MEIKQLNFTVVYDCQGEFKALMEERKFHQHRYFYVMDELGQHEFIHENDIYSYGNIGNAFCYDANDVLRLLRDLNHMDEGQDAKTYIWGFNELQKENRQKANWAYWDKQSETRKPWIMRFLTSCCFNICEVAVLVFFVVLLTSCGTSKRFHKSNYSVEYGSCPVYPETSHYRKHSKRLNPESCNFFGLFGDK